MQFPTLLTHAQRLAGSLMPTAWRGALATAVLLPVITDVTQPTGVRVAAAVAFVVGAIVEAGLHWHSARAAMAAGGTVAVVVGVTLGGTGCGGLTATTCSEPLRLEVPLDGSGDVIAGACGVEFVVPSELLTPQ